MSIRKPWLLPAIFAFVLATAACGTQTAAEDVDAETDAAPAADAATDAAESPAEADGGTAEAQQGGAEGSYPSEDLTFIISFGPGGGTDTLIRTIANILQTHEIWPAEHDISFEYIEGGSGARGYGFFYNQTGNPYYVTTTTGDEVTIPLQSDVNWNGMEYSHVAMLGSSDVVFGVAGNSDWQTLEDFTTWAQENRAILGGGGIIGADALAARQYAEQAELPNWEWVSHDSDGESNASLLSGSIHLMTAPPEGITGLIESGDLRPLGFTGPTLPGKLAELAPDLPLMSELGYDIRSSIPRGLVLPPEAPQEAIDWWADAAAQIVETPEWEEYLYNAGVTPNFAGAEEFREVLQQRADMVAEVLAEQNSGG